MLAPNKDYVDLSKPTLHGLIYLLRHKELWPKRFEWHFPACDHCAMGLFDKVWGVAAQSGMRDAIAKEIGIPLEVAAAAFCVLDVNGKPNWSVHERYITPEMVADKLETLVR